MVVVVAVGWLRGATWLGPACAANACSQLPCGLHLAHPLIAPPGPPAPSQLLEQKVEGLEATGGAGKALADLRKQVAAAAAAASKAGGEAEAVAGALKGITASIQALQAEVAAAAAGSAGSQQQAAGAAEAVASLEQQVRAVGPSTLGRWARGAPLHQAHCLLNRGCSGPLLRPPLLSLKLLRAPHAPAGARPAAGPRGDGASAGFG